MDIFERIREITTPSFAKKPLPSGTSKGLETINQIRSSLNLPAPTPTSALQSRLPQPQMGRLPVAPRVPAMTPVVQPREQRMSVAPRVIAPISQPAFKPLAQITQEKVTKPVFQPTGIKRQITQPEKEAITFFGRKAEPAGKAAENFVQAFNVAKKGEGLTKLERVLKGVEGVGNLASLSNELIVQPVWDSIKLGIKGLRTGQITRDDVDRFIYSTGGEKGTIFEAFGTNEQEFENKFGTPALLTARFLDFAPEFIDPATFGRTGETATFAREVKLGKEALGEGAEQVAKRDEIANALQRFEQQSGQVVDDATKQQIIKNVENPQEFIKNVASEPRGLQRVGGEMGISGVPPSGNIPPVGEQTFRVIPTKERKFPVSVKKAEGTAKEVKNILKDRFDLYSTIKNKDEFAKATKFVDETLFEDALEYIKFADDPREVSYIGQALMQKLQKEGNFANVINVLDVVAEQATKSGQAIQALSVWGRLTPEGALRAAQNTIRKYNTDNKLVEGMPGFIKLTDTKAKEIADQAKRISGAADEFNRALETSKLVQAIARTVPAGIGAKISAVQTLAQLLNPKTFIRNVLGNAIFGTIDALTQTFATPLDLAVSLFTKKRTVAPASIRRLSSGGAEGFKKGLQEALAGADTSGLASQFDLPNASVFDSQIMQGLEKALNVTLKAPDRAFYEATYKDVLEGLMSLAKTDTPTKEMLEIAHYEGLRRTFQDENRVSKLFTTIKRGLNYMGTKDRSFGLGDIVLKYPKTPANLLVRAYEYSPVAYINAVMELARPIMGQAFDQRAFVNNIARATVGTGMINLGLSLGKLGILSPRPDSDKDARNAQDLQGIKSYSFNISALKRYVLSALDADAAKPRVGDQLFSYDWAQPVSLPLAIGANLAETNGKLKEGTFSERVLLSFGPLAGEIIKSADTLTEQSLLQGIQRLFGYGGLPRGLLENILAIPQSFVPTILNQINQYTDNVSRETYSPDLFEASFNQFSAKVPLLAQRLPQRVDVLGRPKERFPNASNTFFNVFFNPAFVDQIKQDPSLKEVIELYEQTGEKGQFPRVVDKTITIDGEKRLLSTQEILDYQRTLGQLSDTLIKQTLTNPKYQDLKPENKALFIGNILSEANKVTKINLFGDNPESLSDRQEILRNNDFENYIQDTLDNKLEQVRKENLKAQGLSYKKAKFPSTRRRGTTLRIPRPKKPRMPKIKMAKIKSPRTRKLTARSRRIRPIKPVNLV